MIDLATSVSEGSLGKAARESLLFGAGFYLVRDVAQFATMLVLVRILSPQDYGIAALSQAFLGIASVVSFNTISIHALQIRDPAKVDWQAHFTAASIVNITLFAMTLGAAGLLTTTQKWVGIALPLAVLSLTLLVEIPATIRHRMLETQHSWARYRWLVMLGTLLGLGCGLLLALAGAGFWALIVQPVLFGVPAAIDLFAAQRFRPDWTWSIRRYRETIRFGANRVLAATMVRGRGFAEQATLSTAFDLGTLGLFTRANGLGMLLAGRLGEMAMSALYPVVTRAPSRSSRFQRLAGLSLRGVVWASAPSVAMLVVAPGDIVALLYGTKWIGVSPLLPFAAMAVSLGGVITVVARLLLATDSARYALFLEVTAGVAAVLLAAIVMPLGAKTYLMMLCILWLPVLTAALMVLIHEQGISRADAMAAFVPPLLCSVSAALVAAMVQAQIVELPLIARLLATALVVGLTYILTLRVIFSRQLLDLLAVSPGGALIGRLLVLQPARVHGNSDIPPAC